jgi:hypothetical protein
VAASRRWAAQLAAALAAIVTCACTAVPDNGAVHAGEQQAPLAAPRVQVQARAPVPGDQPDGIVLGFRYANSDTTEALGAAKAYLADGASWQPEGVTVVDANPVAAPVDTTAGDTTTVKIVDTQVGKIGADGTYQPSPAGTTVEYTYQLTKNSKEKGQWRITNPPPSLVLTVAQIESSYQTGYVYFLRPDERMLVPVRVFLPVSADGLAQALLATLLLGPPDWLKPAVTTALPGGITAPAPTQDRVNGVTTVALPQRIATLSALQRSAIAAQISFTLSNTATLQQYFGQLRIMAGTQPLINSPQLTLQSAKDWKDFDPDAFDAEFYYSDLDNFTRDHTGALVSGDTGRLGLTNLLAPVVAPRATTGNTPALIAGIVKTGTTEALYAGPFTAPKQLLTGSSFTTPSWDSRGNLWTVQQQTSSSPKQVKIAPTGTAALPGPVSAKELANKVIEALKVSRDGTRVAVLAVSTNVSQVFVGAVAKDGTAIENFYPVAPSLTAVTDFVWASSTTLDILGSAPSSDGPGTSSELWSVDIDGWAPSLNVLPVGLPNADSVAAAPGKPLVIGTSSKEVEVYRDNQWSFVGSGTAPHYPG